MLEGLMVHRLGSFGFLSETVDGLGKPWTYWRSWHLVSVILQENTLATLVLKINRVALLMACTHNISKHLEISFGEYGNGVIEAAPAAG
jgi:hypothetical protein